MVSKNEDLNLYSLYIIKDYLSINEENNENELKILLHQLNKEYLLYLIELLNKNNKKLSYIILWILLNVSYIDTNEILFDSNIDIIYKIAIFLGRNKKDKILTYRGLWLLRNITTKNNKIKEILLKYNIIGYFNDIYDIYNLDNEFIHNLLLCIGNFTINPNEEYIMQYLSFVKMIKSQLFPSTNLKWLNRYIIFIYNLSSLNSKEILNELLKEEIYKNLINIYPFPDSIIFNRIDESEKENNNYIYNMKLLILKILGKILSLEDEEESVIQQLIDYGIINFLNKIIDNSENDMKIIKNGTFCISNICTGDYQHINKLYISGIFVKLINIGNNIYKIIKGDNSNIGTAEKKCLYDTFREICYVFSLTIINSTYENLLPFIKSNDYIIIIFIIEALNIFKKKNELIDLYLNAIYHLVNYDQIIEEFNSNIRVSVFTISFSEFMDRNGIKSILEFFILNKNNEISKLAEKIYDIIYK